jgi:glycosyltransferase involved in cell wall biosynthesis
MSTPFNASESKPRALFLAPEAPYPSIGGGPIRESSVLEYLAPRFSVHGIFFREPGAPDPTKAIPRGKLAKADVVDLPFHAKGTLARILRNTMRLVYGRPPLIDRFSGFDPQIEQAMSGEYQVAFIEHFWCASYLDLLRRRAKCVILDVHNVESEWHRSMAAAETGWMAFVHRRFARAALESERFWFPRADRILVTSCNDADVVRKISPHAHVTVYPNALAYVAPPPRAERMEIVFSGNLEYQPNIQAVEFFYRKIWPALESRWPDLHWKILSKNPGGIDRLIGRDPHIELTGFVEDAIAVLAQSQVAVVPLLAGSGTRIKILEAWAARTPVVSTTLGAEGLECRDREHLLLADDPESFTAAVSELLALPDDRARIGSAGRRLYEERYTWQAAWKALDPVLSDISRGL